MNVESVIYAELVMKMSLATPVEEIYHLLLLHFFHMPNFRVSKIFNHPFRVRLLISYPLGIDYAANTPAAESTFRISVTWTGTLKKRQMLQENRANTFGPHFSPLPRRQTTSKKK